MELTIEKYDLINDMLLLFQSSTNNEYSEFGWEDIAFTIFSSTPNETHILFDWDEGKNNDPYWDEDLNKHCVYAFLDRVMDIVR